MTDTKGKSFIEFHKWCMVEEGKGRQFHSRAEYEMAKAGWEAALKMIQRVYQKAREGRDIRFDLGLWDTLKKELGEPFVERNAEFIAIVDKVLDGAEK